MAQIGELDRRIVISYPNESRNTFGEAVPTSFSVLATVWASILPSTGKEALEGKKTVASNEIQFGIRYRKGVTEKMKITYDTNDYNITRIDENVKEGRKRYLILTAEKRF
jgi:SPP1 family predicted phage head-tail adaptor